MEMDSLDSIKSEKVETMRKMRDPVDPVSLKQSTLADDLEEKAEYALSAADEIIRLLAQETYKETELSAATKKAKQMTADLHELMALHI